MDRQHVDLTCFFRLSAIPLKWYFRGFDQALHLVERVPPRPRLDAAQLLENAWFGCQCATGGHFPQPMPGRTRVANRMGNMNAAVRDHILLPCIRAIHLFEGQTDSLLRFFSGRCEVMEVARGEVICQKGRPAPGLFGVLEGSVKVAVISPQGNERVMGIVGPGESFGEASLFVQQPCPVYAETLSRCRLVFIRRSLLLTALQRFPEFALSLIRHLSAGQMQLVRDLEICCLQTASDRVVNYLLDRLPAAEVGGAVVELPAGKAVVACHLNLTPETFSRELHRLADLGLIDVQRRNVRVWDRAALAAQVLGQGQGE
jgi:CRP-like cAMP-binding protein